MTIEYVEPLSRGWNRMKKALFRPFDLRKWFVVGFTAFLAGTTDFHGGNGTGGRGNGNIDWDGIMNFPQEASDWLLSHPTLAILIGIGVVVLAILGVLLVWVSSRGRFMFLDNVVHDRALIAQPWKEYAAEGNSLFVWNLLFFLVVVAILIIYIVECFTSLHSLYIMYDDPARLLRPAIWMIVGLSGILIGVAFIDLLLVSFVVPFMYRDRLKVLDAWSRFIGILSEYPLQVILFSLFYFGVMVIVVVGIVVFGFLTCCIGFLLLAIPYLGDVLLLPISYTMRAFSVEFLEQFGPDYKIFPPGEVQRSAGDLPAAP